LYAISLIAQNDIFTSSSCIFCNNDDYSIKYADG
jgi:hypothetical protein